MLSDLEYWEQRYLNWVCLLQIESNDLMRKAQVFLYANGNNHSPTAIEFDKSLVRDLLFNQSPAKVRYFVSAAAYKFP